MFVVRRPFKCFGEALTPGTIIEPEDIKRFKSRLNDRFIIEVTDENKAAWEEYFKVKFGVTIGESERIVVDSVPAVEEAPAVEEPKVTSAKKPTAKVKAK